MLTIQGDSEERFCDGLSRRIGSLGLGGLAMPQLPKAEAQSGKGKTQKSVIMIFLAGGPPHQDMWDLKVDAHSEIRGEFSPKRTNVPGTEICELFPQLAKISDKLSYVRPIVGAHGGHDAYQCFSGRVPPGGCPSIGSVMNGLQGNAKTGIPAFVGLSPKTAHGRDHWPQVSNHGQVIGATDRLGGEVVDRPEDFQEVFATLYHNTVINVKATTANDVSGRPRFLVDQEFHPMPELV